MIEKDLNKKQYTYFSRYNNLSTYYDTEEKKRYYETNKPIIKNKNIQFITHTVGVNETLDTIALKYYGNPLYWWIIADFNNIQDVFNLKEGYNLKLPNFNQISSQ